MYVAEVRIELKPGVADPEGANTKKALELLGFSGVRSVKSVHAFAVELDAKSEADAKTRVDEMCKRLLVNPVIHAPRVTMLPVGAKGQGPRGKARVAKGSRVAKASSPTKTTTRKAKGKRAGKGAKR